MVHFYINKIKPIPQKPSTCIDCGGAELKEDAVLATMGPSQKDADYVLSVLCLSCETLMVITTNPGAVIGVNHSAGNQATVRNQ
jgi:NAD-dependent SIR2 family protein deacetylase